MFGLLGGFNPIYVCSFLVYRIWREFVLYESQISFLSHHGMVLGTEIISASTVFKVPWSVGTYYTKVESSLANQSLNT